MDKSQNLTIPDYTLSNVLNYKLQGLSNVKVGKIFNKSEHAIRHKLQGIFGLLDIETLNAYKKNKVNLLTQIERELLDNILDKSKIKKANLGNIAYAFDKINNINRLEQGKSTEIHENRDLILSLSAKIEQFRAVPVGEECDNECDNECDD